MSFSLTKAYDCWSLFLNMIDRDERMIDETAVNDDEEYSSSS
jgi:hypothetical protein